MYHAPALLSRQRLCCTGQRSPAHPWQHLPGLLKVLAEHLYFSRQVAVRERIQNAHDSYLRRAAVERLNNPAPLLRLLQAAEQTPGASDE